MQLKCLKHDEGIQSEIRFTADFYAKCRKCSSESECPSNVLLMLLPRCQKPENNIAVERSSDLPKSSTHQPFCSQAASQPSLYQQLGQNQKRKVPFMLHCKFWFGISCSSCIGNGMKRCGPLHLWNLFTKLGLRKLPPRCGGCYNMLQLRLQMRHSCEELCHVFHYQRIALARFSM